MTNDQLTQLLTSGNDAQIEQAIAHFEQQKQVPQDLLVEAFVAFQLVKDKKISKRLTTLLKTYTPNTFQLFVNNKYLLSKHNEALAKAYSDEKEKTKQKPIKMWQEIEKVKAMDTQKLTAYLFPLYPALLWKQMQALTDIKIKDSLFELPQVLAITEMNLSHLKLKDFPQELTFLKNLEILDLSENDFSKADFSQLKMCKKLKKINLKKSKITQLPPILAELTALEEIDLSRNPIAKGDFSFLAKLPQLKKFEIWFTGLRYDVNNNLSISEQFKQLKKLNLSHCELKELPVELCKFIHLEELHLTSNKLSKADFSSLSQLKNLKKIHLESCDFTQLPSILDKLSSLEELYVSENLLDKEDFSFLAKLPQLKRLWIWNEKFDKTETLSMDEQFKQVKKLDFSHVDFKELPIVLSQLTALEELDLTWKKLSPTAFLAFSNLTQLKVLNLKHCGLTQLPVGLHNFINLETLNLEYNNLTAADFTPLTQLKYLKTLNLRYCNLPQIPETLRELTMLEELSLASNKLSKADFISLAMLKKLKKLSLSALDESHIPYPSHVTQILTTLADLEELDLSFNDLSAADLTPLKKLKKLNLYRTRILQLPQGLSKMIALEELDLGYNNLSKADLTPLLALENLKKLNIGSSYTSIALFPEIIALKDRGVEISQRY